MSNKNVDSQSLYPGMIIRTYVIKEKIGDGSYGEVYKVTKTDDDNKTELVLKEIQLKKCENKSQLEMVKNEAPILSKLKSDYVVQYYDSFEENNNVYIIMEYCEGGDLSHYLSQYEKKNNKLLNEDVIWKIFIQICLGLLHIHNNKILHRDLKSLNIFLTKDLNVKIGDLGVAKILKHTSHATTIIGTPYYLSPEICEEKPYNEKSDVWSLGCILYEIMTFKHPFNAGSTPALFIKILNGRSDPLPSVYYPSELKKIVESLLEKNYYKRPSMKELIQLPIFQIKAKKLGLDQAMELFGPNKEKIKMIKLNQIHLNKRNKMRSINNLKQVNKIPPLSISVQKKHYGSDLKDFKVSNSNSEKKLNIASNKNKIRVSSTEKRKQMMNSNKNNQISVNIIRLSSGAKRSPLKENNNNIFNTSNNSNSGDEKGPPLNADDFLKEITLRSSESKFSISSFLSDESIKQTANTTGITSNKISHVPTDYSPYKQTDQTMTQLNPEILGTTDVKREEDFIGEDGENYVDEFIAEEGIEMDEVTQTPKEDLDELKEKYKAKYYLYYNDIKSYSNNKFNCDKIFEMYKEIEDNKSSVDDVIKRIQEFIRKELPSQEMEFITLFFNLIYYQQQYSNIEKEIELEEVNNQINK